MVDEMSQEVQVDTCRYIVIYRAYRPIEISDMWLQRVSLADILCKALDKL